ncbi:MAG: bile acid:sodium symporter family protein, partial [Spongiibacteraceae bacterium]
GVMLVFFLHGANLAPKNLRQGITNWRLHVFVQGATYVLFPLLGALMFFGGRNFLPTDLLLGLFYLCALPSTITSSVAMTALARGNIAGAVFNATLSGLIGMLITPALMSVVMNTAGHTLPLLPSILGVMQTLLLPFICGQLLRPLLVNLLTRWKSVVTLLDRAVIVLIVHASFCESSKAQVWSSYPVASMLLLFAITAVLLIVVLYLTTQFARALGFSREDEIAAVFCGSKKSLANGMPMANVLLAGHAGLGVLVLPMMIYHQLQLLVCSVLAQRYAARSTTAEARSATASPTSVSSTSASSTHASSTTASKNKSGRE